MKPFIISLLCYLFFASASDGQPVSDAFAKKNITGDEKYDSKAALKKW